MTKSKSSFFQLTFLIGFVCIAFSGAKAFSWPDPRTNSLPDGCRILLKSVVSTGIDLNDENALPERLSVILLDVIQRSTREEEVFDLTKALIEQGANLGLYTDKLESTLSTSIEKRYFKIAKYILLNAQAEELKKIINLGDGTKNNETPYTIAVRVHASQDFLRLLISMGANSDGKASHYRKKERVRIDQSLLGRVWVPSADFGLKNLLKRITH